MTHTPLRTIASDKQTEIKFENARVPAANLMGAEGQGWATFKKIANKATVLECAYLVGLAQQDFDITINYAKERVQFGRPIGSFQAIQHKAADMVTDVDGSRFIMYKAAWAVAEDESDADEQVHMAKAWMSRRHPPRRRPRPADPRWHRLHQGLQDPALLPPPEGRRAGLGRRRLPPRAGRPGDGDLVAVSFQLSAFQPEGPDARVRPLVS